MSAEAKIERAKIFKQQVRKSTLSNVLFFEKK